MSDTPRTDLQLQVGAAQGHDGYVHGAFARVLEGELADQKARHDAETTNLRKELAELTAAFQAECDHEFVTEDHSFSHEFGTEKIFVCRCTKCGKDAEPGDVPDPRDDGCDDGPRDPREAARLDP